MSNLFKNGQTSIDILAAIKGKRYKSLPWMNRTQKGFKNKFCEELPQELVDQFKRNNDLDYLIYNYCVEKFKRKLAERKVMQDSNSINHFLKFFLKKLLQHSKEKNSL